MHSEGDKRTVLLSPFGLPPFESRYKTARVAGVYLRTRAKEREVGKVGNADVSESMFNIVAQMVALLLIMAAGYVAKKAKVTTGAIDKGLSGVVLKVTLPAMLLASALDADTLPTVDQVVATGIGSLGMFAVSIVMAFVVTAVLRIHRGNQGAFRFMTVFGNIGFMGFPVCQAIYGNEGLIYASVFQLPFGVLVYTLGVYFLAQDNGPGVKIELSPKSFLSPALVASLATLALVLLNVHSVPVLGPALTTLGSMTTPGALLVIGSSLADMPLGDLAGGPRLWICSLVRLLVTPLVVWAIFSHVISDPVVLGVTVALSGMPAATNGTMLAYEYGGNTRVISQGIFFTTVFSLVTIPLLLAFVGA